MKNTEKKTFILFQNASEIFKKYIVNKNSCQVGRGGAIGKTLDDELESDDRSPLVLGSNPVAAAFAFAKLRKKFRQAQ